MGVDHPHGSNASLFSLVGAMATLLTHSLAARRCCRLAVLLLLLLLLQLRLPLLLLLMMMMRPS